MKKYFALAAVVVMMSMLLAGCSKFTCDLCMKEKAGKKHETKLLGQEIVICDDCYDDLQTGLDILS